MGDINCGVAHGVYAWACACACRYSCKPYIPLPYYYTEWEGVRGPGMSFACVLRGMEIRWGEREIREDSFVDVNGRFEMTM